MIILEEIYATGFRNPHRFTRDEENGGRVFLSEASSFKLGSQALIQELDLKMEDGQSIPCAELTDNIRTGHNRGDLRFGLDADGELYLFTKANGKIFKVVGATKQSL